VQKFFGLIRILCCNFSKFFVLPGGQVALCFAVFALKELHVNVMEGQRFLGRRTSVVCLQGL
jgi:hypothetical protein